ncbi:MAG: hypothetical protein L3J89_03345 [Gammaproteobacteria bacterium]|nr:hypothetical protein [Gammaproteobacteria bacterium]
MKTVDVLVVKLLQLIVTTFFLFVLSLWYGSILLAPLAVWYNLSAFLGGGIFATLVASGLTVGLGFYIAKLPGLIDTMIKPGVEMYKLALSTVCGIGRVASAINPKTETEKNEDKPANSTASTDAK